MNKLFHSNKFIFFAFLITIFVATFTVTTFAVLGVKNIFTNYPKAQTTTSGVYVKVTIGSAVELMNMSNHTSPETAYRIIPSGNTKLDFYAYVDANGTLSTSCSAIYKMYFHNPNWTSPYTYEKNSTSGCTFTENIDTNKIYAAGYFKYDLTYRDATKQNVITTFWIYIEPKFANSICKTPSTSNDQVKKCIFYKCLNGDTNKDGICNLSDNGATETIYENGVNDIVINNRTDCYKYGPSPIYVNGLNVNPLCYQYDFHDGSDLICSSDATFKKADVNETFAQNTDVCTSTANICGDGILRADEQCEYRKETSTSYDKNGTPLPANKVCNNCKIEEKVTTCNVTSCKVDFSNGCWTISDNGAGQCSSQLKSNSVHTVYFKCSSLSDGKCGCQDANGNNITPNSDYSNCKNLYQGGNIEIGKSYCPASYFDKPDNTKVCAQVDFTCAMNGTPAGGSAACYVAPVQKPDLTIDKKVNGDKDIVVNKDSEVTFSLKVTNIGDGSVNDKVTVTDTMPSGLSLTVNPTGIGWTCNVALPTFTCVTTNSITLAKNASLPEIIFKAKPTEYNKIYTNLVSVKLNAQSESNTNNNSSSAAVGTNPAPVLVKCSVGDKVWNDANNNGIIDSNETGVSGAIIVVYEGTKEVARVTTDQNGNYNISNLDCKTYTVKVISGVTGINTTNNANGQTVILNPTTNKDPVNVDFGYYSPVPITIGTIGDTFYFDLNKNGKQDADETGISNVTVQLVDKDGKIIATATTDANGHYLFTNVPFGTYTVRPIVTTLPAGYTNTTGNTNGQTNVTISATSQNNLTADFGYFKSKTCADIAFNPVSPATLVCGQTKDFSFDSGALSSAPTITSGSEFGNISYYKLDEYAAVQMRITANANVNGNMVVNLPIKQTTGETMNCPVTVQVSCVIPTSPKLSITKTILQNNVNSISYNILVKNEGNTEVKAVRILDNYDATRMTLASTNPTFDTNTDSSSIGTFVINNIGDLAVGAAKNIIVIFNIKQDAQTGLACNYGGEAKGTALKNNNSETTSVSASFSDTTNSLCTQVTKVVKDKAYINLTKVNKTGSPVEIGQKVQWEITSKNLCSGNCDAITSLKYTDSFDKNYLSLSSVFVQKKNADGSNASENISLTLDINSANGNVLTFGANNVLSQLGNSLTSGQYLVFEVYTTSLKAGDNVLNNANIVGPNNEVSAQAVVSIKAKPVPTCDIQKDGSCANGSSNTNSNTTTNLPKTAGLWTFDNIPESLVIALIIASLSIAFGVAYPTLKKMNYK